jgi:diguanylate cyclase (GGDEF)-like protein
MAARLAAGYVILSSVSRSLLSSDSEKTRRLAPGPIALTWGILLLSIALLLGQAVASFAVGRTGLPELALAIATALLVASAVLNARAAGMKSERRHWEAENFSRLVQALSRSMSPSAVIEAIVHELGSAVGADHVAIVQMRPGGAILDVTFVSMLPGSQTTNAVMPVRQLEPADTRRLAIAPRHTRLPLPRHGTIREEVGLLGAKPPVWRAGAEHGHPGGRPSLTGIVAGVVEAWRSRREPRPGDPARDGEENHAQQLANQVAHRLRDAYGLRNTLAAPLEDGGAVVGAIVLSRRTQEPWTESAVRLLNSAAGETSLTLARVYSQQAAEEEARTDQLTRLPNRRHFDEYCTLLASRRRLTDRVAILAVDVDHFKRLNDMYGHQIGDQVLRAIGNAIQISVREDDLPARYGGEEFIVLLRNPALGVALEIGERIRTTVREMDLVDFGVTDRVTVSVGVASGKGAGEPISDIVERADRALYAAKRTGRDRVVEAWPSDSN